MHTNKYQDLFNYFAENYDLLLTVSEMDEIIKEVARIEQD
jgi:hypothetical protein